jgi:hypothetical protein
MDVAQLITGLGGQQAVAGRLGLGKSAIGMWVLRGAVPKEHRLDLWRMALEARLAWEPEGADSIRHLLGAPAPAATQAA